LVILSALVADEKWIDETWWEEKNKQWQQEEEYTNRREFEGDAFNPDDDIDVAYMIDEDNDRGGAVAVYNRTKGKYYRLGGVSKTEAREMALNYERRNLGKTAAKRALHSGETKPPVVAAQDPKEDALGLKVLAQVASLGEKEKKLTGLLATAMPKTETLSEDTVAKLQAAQRLLQSEVSSLAQSTRAVQASLEALVQAKRDHSQSVSSNQTVSSMSGTTTAEVKPNERKATSRKRKKSTKPSGTTSGHQDTQAPSDALSKSTPA
jgi:hypothetical protein